MAKLMKNVNKAAIWLVAVGALNWLLLSLADFDLVDKLVVAIEQPAIGTFLYSLIGVAGAWVGILALMGKITIKN